MSALAGTSSPKPNLVSVRSLWLFEILTKGHVCHVRVNKRPVIPTCFVSVTLSAGRPHSVLFKWACLQSVKSTAAIWKWSWSDRWTVALSAFSPPPMLSAPRFANGRTWATLLSIVKQPTGTHRKSISAGLLFDMLRVNRAYPDMLPSEAVLSELHSVLKTHSVKKQNKNHTDKGLITSKLQRKTHFTLPTSTGIFWHK